MSICPEEFLPAREASRELGKVIARLREGRVDKYVIVNRNKPQAVLLTFERYAELASTAAKAQGWAVDIEASA